MGPKKRPAVDDLGEQQRLSKRFNLLNLDHASKLWIAPPSQPPTPSSHPNEPTIHPLPPSSNPASNSTDHLMQLEDTKHTLYIHDLSAELASIDAPSSSRDPPLIFIPDIERHLNQLPNQLLRGGGGAPGNSYSQQQQQQPSSGGELVLYSVPSSLTVPAERDSVRRAILEARARAREKQGQMARDGEVQEKEMAVELGPGGVSGEVEQNLAHDHDGDDDAMDLN